MNSAYIVEYRNIYLRPLEKEDLEILRKIRNDSNVSRFLTKISYISEKQQENWYQKVLASEKEIIFAVEEKERLKRCVGSCSLYQIDGNQALFGKIAIDPDARGMHTGTNAIISALHVGFKELGLEKIDLFVDRENHVAGKVYSGIGFENVGKQDEKQDRMTITHDLFYKENASVNGVIISSV